MDEELQDYEKIPMQSANIQQFHLLYMETMYRLNKNAVERFVLEKEGKFAAAAQIIEKDGPILYRAREISKRVRLLRRFLWDQYEAGDAQKAYIDAKAKDDIVWWINNFAWTYDPRLVAMGIPPDLPFIMFPAQEEFIRTVESCYKTNTSVLVEKSRAWGLTELFCAWDVHHWLFQSGYKGSWASRVEDAVDKLKDPDTIFARIRRIIYYLPQKMRPNLIGHVFAQHLFANRLQTAIHVFHRIG